MSANRRAKKRRGQPRRCDGPARTRRRRADARSRPTSRKRTKAAHLVLVAAHGLGHRGDLGHVRDRSRCRADRGFAAAATQAQAIEQGEPLRSCGRRIATLRQFDEFGRVRLEGALGGLARAAGRPARTARARRPRRARSRRTVSRSLSASGAGGRTPQPSRSVSAVEGDVAHGVLLRHCRGAKRRSNPCLRLGEAWICFASRQAPQ